MKAMEGTCISSERSTQYSSFYSWCKLTFKLQKMNFLDHFDSVIISNLIFYLHDCPTFVTLRTLLHHYRILKEFLRHEFGFWFVHHSEFHTLEACEKTIINSCLKLHFRRVEIFYSPFWFQVDVKQECPNYGQNPERRW